MYSRGITGPYKDYIIAYHAFTQRHNEQEMFIKVNAKRHTIRKPPSFEDLYPDTSLWMRLGADPVKTQSQMALGTLKGVKGAPQWLMDLAQEQEV